MKMQYSTTDAVVQNVFLISFGLFINLNVKKLIHDTNEKDEKMQWISFHVLPTLNWNFLLKFSISTQQSKKFVTFYATRTLKRFGGFES